MISCTSSHNQRVQQKRTRRRRRRRRSRRRRSRRRRRHLSNDIIAAELVLVHDSDNYGGLPQHVGRHIKWEGLVEHRVETALHYHRLLLFHALVLVHQPHFYIGVCGGGKLFFLVLDHFVTLGTRYIDETDER